MVEDAMSRSTTEGLEWHVGGRDVPLYFFVCLKAEIRGLPVTCVAYHQFTIINSAIVAALARTFEIQQPYQ